LKCPVVKKGDVSSWTRASADANLVLLDSLIAERGDGTLIIGRGVPNNWVTSRQTIAVTNVPISGGHHLGVTVTTGGSASVTLTLTGDTPGRADPVPTAGVRQQHCPLQRGRCQPGHGNRHLVHVHPHGHRHDASWRLT
jgi:hypothetical protein